jgi:valyl-tRNA synthetase
MIFQKKSKAPQHPLRDAPESLEYKKNIRDIDPNFDPSNNDNSSNDLPELEEQHENLPPLQAHEELDMPPKEEKRMKKFSKEKEIFVKMDNFKDIVQSIEKMEQKLKDLENLIEKLQKLNDSEVTEINSWKSDLDDLRDEIRNIGDNLARE